MNVFRLIEHLKENIDWKQKTLEISSVFGLSWFTTISLTGFASFMEKFLTFAISAALAWLALQRHKKKMRLMDLEEQERIQRLYDLGAERKKRENEIILEQKPGSSEVGKIE